MPFKNSPGILPKSIENTLQQFAVSVRNRTVTLSLSLSPIISSSQPSKPTQNRVWVSCDSSSKKGLLCLTMLYPPCYTPSLNSSSSCDPSRNKLYKGVASAAWLSLLCLHIWVPLCIQLALPDSSKTWKKLMCLLVSPKPRLFCYHRDPSAWRRTGWRAFWNASSMNANDG